MWSNFPSPVSGNTTYYGDDVTLTTLPGTGTRSANGATLAANSSATYTLDPANQTLEFNVLMPIDSSFLDLYQSSNGTGFVSFFASSSPQVSITGGQGGFDMSGVTANTVLRLDYSYIAVPEPSTYALFGLGALALVVAYRRKVA
ncbi:MAG: PEP-CTERM sorting domain-containing protein [Proteobacteria bacterium]|nr:PEP-CTERM sorting domain-containing protein [Pseudomonadota bacterium]